jgi:hypothetical protein
LIAPKQYVRESLVPAQDAVLGYSSGLHDVYLLAAFPAHQIATEVSRISHK